MCGRILNVIWAYKSKLWGNGSNKCLNDGKYFLRQLIGTESVAQEHDMIEAVKLDDVRSSQYNLVIVSKILLEKVVLAFDD